MSGDSLGRWKRGILFDSIELGICTSRCCGLHAANVELILCPWRVLAKRPERRDITTIGESCHGARDSWVSVRRWWGFSILSLTNVVSAQIVLPGVFLTKILLVDVNVTIGQFVYPKQALMFRWLGWARDMRAWDKRFFWRWNWFCGVSFIRLTTWKQVLMFRWLLWARDMRANSSQFWGICKTTLLAML